MIKLANLSARNNFMLKGYYLANWSIHCNLPLWRKSLGNANTARNIVIKSATKTTEKHEKELGIVAKFRF